MRKPTHHYTSDDEDSARWAGFAFRHGDIVISTRSKSGTTWMQMICALLIFQTPRLPAPLAQLSPWMDWLIQPRDEVWALLERQPHRRFVKTHTPLDGLPLDDRATYIVVARHPLDMAVSLYHQGDNLDRQRIAGLTGRAPATADRQPPRPSVRDWVRSWIEQDPDPRRELDSLPGVLHHLSDAWRRRDDPNILLVHYDDLSTHREGEMRRLADRLGITVPPGRWPELVAAAGFDRMRAAAADLAPDPAGVLKDRSRFFRRGTSGAGRDVLSSADLARYHARVESMAAPDLLGWLHRPS